MAAEASRSVGAADSYIGSLISLTSKFEIRYEGILYNINTEESSIGLRNVRSFGTEGRKKDGPQVPSSDKVYEYILFRGSDIKDLQVKSSPPVQAPPTIHSDPAIIQSHYSQPAPVPSSVPSSGGGPLTDPSSLTLQMGLPRATFQSGVPLYQPGVSLGSWGSSPTPPSGANVGGLAMPMYWQGFYGPSNGLSHVQQQSLLRSIPGLSMPQPPQQPTQYPGAAPIPIGSSNMAASNFLAPKLPASTLEMPTPLLPPVSSAPMNLTFGNLAPSMLSNMVPTKSSALASETSTASMSNTIPVSVSPTSSLSGSLPLVSQLTTSSSDVNPIIPVASKPKTVPSMSLPYQTMAPSGSTFVGVSNSQSHQTETSTPPLLTPDQFLHPAPTIISTSMPLKPDNKMAEVALASSSEPPLLAPREGQAPILPLPSPPNRKLNGAPLYTHNNQLNRGRGRGRGNGILHPVTKFTEEFDFMAMNEKFKKDEVWGHLGKTNKEEDGKEDEYDFQDEDVRESSNFDTKPVYVKDDFFDSLSCNALERGQQNGRAKFSEQMKIDTETFGDFPRYRGGRWGRMPGRGGRSYGSYYGRGGYSYGGRGRGQGQGRGYNNYNTY